MARKTQPKSRIVEATGTAGGGGGGGIWAAIEIEEVMANAAAAAAEEGITDPDEIRDIKLKARADFKAERREQEEQRIADEGKRREADAKKADSGK